MTCEVLYNRLFFAGRGRDRNWTRPVSSILFRRRAASNREVLDSPKVMERARMLDPVRRDPGVAKLLASVKNTWENFMREFGTEE